MGAMIWDVFAVIGILTVCGLGLLAVMVYVTDKYSSEADDIED
jgi:hypothetical protein